MRTHIILGDSSYLINSIDRFVTEYYRQPHLTTFVTSMNGKYWNPVPLSMPHLSDKVIWREKMDLNPINALLPL